MPFVKLDIGILDSSLWVDRAPREIFITGLLMAEPFELVQPAAQLEVRSLDKTGFIVPPGWYGLIAAAGIGIIRRALVPEKQGFLALEALGQPDLESRSDDFEGRRLVRIDGGYIVLNFMRYRDKDHGAAERMRKLRERQKASNSEHVTPVTRNDRNVPPNVTQAESREQIADADAEKNKNNARPVSGDIASLIEKSFAFYCNAVGRNPRRYTLTKVRREKAESRIRERLAVHDGDLAAVEAEIAHCIRNLAESDWHKANGHLDWIEQIFRSAEEFEKRLCWEKHHGGINGNSRPFNSADAKLNSAVESGIAALKTLGIDRGSAHAPGSSDGREPGFEWDETSSHGGGSLRLTGGQH